MFPSFPSFRLGPSKWNGELIEPILNLYYSQKKVELNKNTKFEWKGYSLMESVAWGENNYNFLFRFVQIQELGL